MRARFENIVPAAGRSFHVEERRVPHFDAPWHFHPEVELTYILESRGRRFVGDSIEPFTAGDLVLLGSNLPHFWHNEGRMRRHERAHSIVVQFRPEFLGTDFLEKPELVPVQRLLARAHHGLVFAPECSREVGAILRTLPAQKGLPALVTLLSILERLARSDAHPLTSAAYSPPLDNRAQDRLTRVYAFMVARFRDPITLPQIAYAAAMTPAAFSRYFTRATGRNVSLFLNELRVGYAAGLLRETPRSVADIALASGFPTLSNFNRRFRERMKCSPREFRKVFNDNAGSGANFT